MLKKISSLILFVLVLVACEPSEPKKGGGKFGMLNSDIPEFAATEFFEHIYHQKKIDGAVELSTPKMARLLASYHTNRGVQKHVLNMRFDKVVITPTTRSAGRNEFAKEASIDLMFEGELNGDIVKDMRTVKMKKIDNDWKVDQVTVN